MKSIRTEAGKAVAFVNRGPAAEANERLIKAAPDMLALLERIIDARRAGGMPDYLIEAAIDMVREVAGA